MSRELANHLDLNRVLRLILMEESVFLRILII